MNRPVEVLTTCLIVICAAIRAGAQNQDTKISVRVFNRSGIAVSPLLNGERHAADTLENASVHVTWLNCPAGTQECIEPPTSTKLVLTILKQGSRMGGEDVLGLAVQDEKGSGTYCYIFENKLNEISGQMHINISRLLGYAMAHEIGHLLKGSHSHSPTGVMSGLWSGHQLEQAARGALQFTQQDASILRARVGAAVESGPKL
jgi:hypothetical protein